MKNLNLKFILFYTTFNIILITTKDYLLNEFFFNSPQRKLINLYLYITSTYIIVTVFLYLSQRQIFGLSKPNYKRLFYGSFIIFTLLIITILIDITYNFQAKSSMMKR